MRDSPARHPAAVWVLVAAVISCLVSLTYLVTYPVPTQTAGVYLAAAQEYAAHGLGAGYHVPGYTRDGLFFPYPPLGLVLTGVFLDAGLDPLAAARFLPPLYTLLYLPAGYLLAAEVLDTPRQAGLATVVLALSPDVFNHHLAAGGIVRAPAYLFALLSLYAALRAFRTHAPRWALAAGVGFGLTLLAHPVNALFVGASTLAFYAVEDRTLPGLGLGAGVAALGAVVASPWWLPLALDHGVGVFLAAGGSRSGARLPYSVLAFLNGGRMGVVQVFRALAVVGAVYLAFERRLLLPAWLAATFVMTGLSRFTMLVGACIAAVAVTELLLPRAPALDRPRVPVSGASAGHVLVLALLVAYGVAGAVMTTSGVGVEDETFRPFITQDTLAAAQWVERETHRNASFVVAGKAYEWLPLLTDRRVLVTRWGTEWTDRYGYHRATQSKLSSCLTADCLAPVVDRVAPDYVFVQTGVTANEPRRVLVESLHASDRYRAAYEEGDVAVFRVTGNASADRSATAVRPAGGADTAVRARSAAPPATDPTP